MINFSMMNGIVDSIANWFADVLGQIFDLIMDLFAFIFYWLFCLIGELADMIQALFRAFCGLGNSSLINGKPTDDVYDLFLSPQVTNVLISLGVLAIFLLIITTAIAVVKTEFVGFGEKGQNSKSKVIGTSLKALANIFIVPLCCILGVVAVNAVLRAVDGATGGGQQVSLARQVFVATAKSGNKLRTNFSEEFNTGKCSNAIEHGVNTFGLDFKSYIGVAGGNGADSNPEKFAMVVDYLFLHNESFGEEYLKAAEEGRVQIVSDSADIIDNASNTVGSADDGYDYYVAKNGGWGIADGKILRECSFDYTNKGLVRVFYDLSNFNIIVALLAAILIAFNLLTMILTVIKRMFELVVLFVISPPIVAITPIDGGSAMKNWRQKFVGSLLAVFGPIVAINMLFIILPLIFQIDFLGDNGLAAAAFTDMGQSGIQAMAEILITCAAITYVRDLSGTISSIIGANNTADTDNATRAFTRNVRTARAIGGTMGAAASAPVRAGLSALQAARTGHNVGEAVRGSLWDSANSMFGSAVDTINQTTGSQINNRRLAERAYNALQQGGHNILSVAGRGNAQQRDQHRARALLLGEARGDMTMSGNDRTMRAIQRGITGYNDAAGNHHRGLMDEAVETRTATQETNTHVAAMHRTMGDAPLDAQGNVQTDANGVPLTIQAQTAAGTDAARQTASNTATANRTLNAIEATTGATANATQEINRHNMIMQTQLVERQQIVQRKEALLQQLKRARGRHRTEINNQMAELDNQISELDEQIGRLVRGEEG